MTQKKKLDENQMWTLVLAILPVIILMNVGKEFVDDSGMRILYAGLLGGIGGLIGFVANLLTKNRSRLAKILATI